MPNKAKIFSDGGARGNPGPAAAAFIIISENGETLKISRFLGKRTNNQAEYEALIAALESALQMGLEEIDYYLDSELVCKHLTGEYKVKNPDLKALLSKAQKLKSGFKTVHFTNVPRTNIHIREADALLNQELDKVTK